MYVDTSRRCPQIIIMMCTGPFCGAQDTPASQTRAERRSHMDWKRGDVASEGNCFCLKPLPT